MCVSSAVFDAKDLPLLWAGALDFLSDWLGLVDVPEAMKKCSAVLAVDLAVFEKQKTLASAGIVFFFIKYIQIGLSHALIVNSFFCTHIMYLFIY
jgi:hypothetical protein